MDAAWRLEYFYLYSSTPINIVSAHDKFMSQGRLRADKYFVAILKTNSGLSTSHFYSYSIVPRWKVLKWKNIELYYATLTRGGACGGGGVRLKNEQQQIIDSWFKVTATFILTCHGFNSPGRLLNLYMFSYLKYGPLNNIWVCPSIRFLDPPSYLFSITWSFIFQQIYYYLFFCYLGLG